MGVYINMKMPKCCAECDVEGHYENSCGDEYGFFCPFGYKAYTEEMRDAKRLDNCPLVPIPPHGRLIDADEIKTAFPCGESVRTECVRATIDNAPTVLETEEGE